MTCRRAFELDLTAFLAEPRAAAWDEFRAHYPRCPDCAREVAAWTALHALLDAGHPDAATLLRLADRPDALDATGHARLEAHVARCPSCSDELRALARFAPEHARPAAAEAPAPARRTSARRRGVVRRAARVLWHPALPYAALLALVLSPAFRARLAGVDERTISAPAAEQGSRAASKEAGAEAPRDATPAALRAPREVPAAARRAAEAEMRLEDRVVASRDQTAAPRAAPPRPAAPEPEPAPPAAGAARFAAEVAADAARPTLALEGDPGATLRTLAIDLPATSPRAATYSVHVAAEDGTRELRQVVTASPGARRITLELPGAWLEPGRYRVEVAPQDGAAPMRSTLDVPPG